MFLPTQVLFALWTHATSRCLKAVPFVFLALTFILLWILSWETVNSLYMNSVIPVDASAES